MVLPHIHKQPPPYTSLAIRLDRTEASIFARVAKLRHKTNDQTGAPPWTSDEEQIILDNHVPSHSDWDRVALLLPRRSVSAIKEHYRYNMRTKDHSKPKVRSVSYAGSTLCLCCRKKFQSWDVRKNRLCPVCTQRSTISE